ncbi:MAG: flagellin [Anaerobiospirillum succiniciproducens]|uniref:flagellin N-terminal helical domain-containing protein n=1 Tax=Anaerobiospirillum succiniciproducens TaxID=13335 RepID=UPI002A764B9A|nr:flagellin [Anaerobiospirillum succiniciproducens]MDY2799320.1 flagellin [Anaerobiospirillum succiniciproducens]
MAVYVNTNYSALQGQRYLSNVNTQLTTTYQRLSSGMRINSAKDDAAGLQISDRLTSQINGLNQGNRNASDGIALAQTIEAGIDEISGMLQKVRTLSVQAANGTNTQSDRDALAKEASSLVAEMQRIATQTTYAGKTVLAGNTNDSIFSGGGKWTAAGKMTLQVGSNKGDTISFNVESFVFSQLVNGNLGGFNTDNAFKGKVASQGKAVAFSDAAAAAALIDTMDKLIAKVDAQRADLGAIQNRLESSIRNQSNVAANEADARSRIRDADFAQESANLTQQNIIQQAASSMLMQANTRPQLGLSLIG